MKSSYFPVTTGVYPGVMYMSSGFDDIVGDSQDDIYNEISSYRNLPEGWDFGVGMPASEEAIKRALIFYSIGRKNGFNAEAHPLTEGGVSLTLYINDHFFEIDIYNDLRTDLNYEIGKGLSYKRMYNIVRADFLEVFIKLMEIKATCANTSEPSDLLYTVKQEDDLNTTKYFGIIEDQSQFSGKIVQFTEHPKEFALI